MIIKTKEFREASDKILVAIGADKSAANLELVTRNNYLYLNVTNREFYVSVKFPIDTEEQIHAVVNAVLFLDLISSLSTETFEMFTDSNVLKIKANKSNYKIAMIFDGEELLNLPVIALHNINVSMKISSDVLSSILNVNSKELNKAKNLDVDELQKLYYIDEGGCFTFTTGACLNMFTLEKPVRMLLNDRIVKLFKLFNTDVNFSLGYDVAEQSTGRMHTKVVFMTEDTYVAAIINCDDVLINKIVGPCNATKNFINALYDYRAVINVSSLEESVSRIMMFKKNSFDKQSLLTTPISCTLTPEELILADQNGNSESVQVENDNNFSTDYNFTINAFDLKSILESCKNEHFTMSLGNHKSVIVTHGQINHLMKELA